MQELINFPGINIQSLSQYILLLMLSTLRIGSFLLSSPFFGSRMIPLPVRIVFSFSLGIWFLNNLKFPYIETLQGIEQQYTKINTCEAKVYNTRKHENVMCRITPQN